MNVDTALRSGLRVLVERPASVLPVYLLVIGLTAMARVPVVVGLAAIFGILIADGRFEALVEALQAVDIESLQGVDEETLENVESLNELEAELGTEVFPPELQSAVLDLFSAEIVALGGGAVALSILISILVGGLSNAAAINGIYGCLYASDGVADAVDGVGRDWKSFIGISIVRTGVFVIGVIPLVVGVSLFTVSPFAGIAGTLVGFLLVVGIVIVGLLALAFAGQSVVVDGVGIGTAIQRSVRFPVRQPTTFLAYVLVSLGVFGGLAVLGGGLGALGVSQLSGILSSLVAIPFLDAFKTALYADRPFDSLGSTDDGRQLADAEAVDDRDSMVDNQDSMADNQDSMADNQDSMADNRDSMANNRGSMATDRELTTADQSGVYDRESRADGGDRSASSDNRSQSVSTDDHSGSAADRPLSDDDRSTSTDDQPASAVDQPATHHRFIAAFRDGLNALGGFTRSHPGPILVAAVLFSAAAVGGWQVTAAYALDLPPTENVGEIFGTVPIDTFVMLAANNWLVSATAAYSGVALGIPTAVDMVLNGFIVGALAGVIDPMTFVALVAPHGVIELPAIIIAGGLGFHLAAVVAGVLRGNRTSTELAESLRLVYRVLLGLAVVLVVAAFIEAFLTPLIADVILA